MDKRIWYVTLIIIAMQLVLGGSALAEDHEGSWYAGFGVGAGNLSIENGSLESYLKDSSGGRYSTVDEDEEMIALHLGAGYIVTPRLHLGIDISSVKQEAVSQRYDPSDDRGPVNIEIQLINYFAAASYYPFEKGLFIKVAGGFSVLSQDENSVAVDDRSDIYSGTGYMLGIGYDLPIVKRLHIGIHADYSRQSYGDKDAPDDTEFTAVYLTVYWY
jgi:Outer membrane protein beta-barrel domain